MNLQVIFQVEYLLKLNRGQIPDRPNNLFFYCSQEVNPDPIALADFEDIFHSVGGVRAWSGERLTSPLVLSDVYDRNYGHWCRNKSRCDPNNLLQSCYIQVLLLVEFSSFFFIDKLNTE